MKTNHETLSPRYSTPEGETKEVLDPIMDEARKEGLQAVAEAEREAETQNRVLTELAENQLRAASHEGGEHVGRKDVNGKERKLTFAEMLDGYGMVRHMTLEYDGKRLELTAKAHMDEKFNVTKTDYTALRARAGEEGGELGSWSTDGTPLRVRHGKDEEVLRGTMADVYIDDLLRFEEAFEEE